MLRKTVGLIHTRSTAAAIKIWGSLGLRSDNRSCWIGPIYQLDQGHEPPAQSAKSRSASKPDESCTRDRNSLAGDLLGIVVQPLDLHLIQRGFDSHRSQARRGASTAAPWRRAEIHPECPEEPQIRLESGGEAERSPIVFSRSAASGIGCSSA